MSDVRTTIKFDGPALEGKAMDVGHLAPSLLALSDLVKEANRYANGERAGVRVMVNADLDQKCFELNVDLVMTIWEQAKLLISDDDVRTAKEIAEWVGILAGTTAATVTGTLSLLKLVKFLRGRKVESVTILKMDDGRNVVEIRVEGVDEPVRVLEPVYELYANLNVRRKAVDILAPLREEGYESLEFYDGDEQFVTFGHADLPAVDGSDMPDVIPQNVHRSTIRTGVKIRRAAYEGKSRWTIMYKRAVEAAFDDQDWLERFQSGRVSAPPGSYLEVDLEETYITNENDEIMGDPSYRIARVHGVTQPAEQRRMVFREERWPLDTD